MASVSLFPDSVRKGWDNIDLKINHYSSFEGLDPFNVLSIQAGPNRVVLFNVDETHLDHLHRQLGKYLESMKTELEGQSHDAVGA